MQPKEPPPAATDTSLACAPSTLETCTRPRYEFGPQISADAAAATAIAESKALDACATRHEALVDCVKRYERKIKGE